MSDPVKLGTVHDDDGELIEAFREADGGVTFRKPLNGARLGFTPAGMDAVREMLGRAAMPGQVPSRVKHGPWCDCTPCKAEPGYEARRAPGQVDGG